VTLELGPVTEINQDRFTRIDRALMAVSSIGATCSPR
jgi:hypothetical protein